MTEEKGVRVRLPSSLRRFSGGHAAVCVTATSVREMLQGLDLAFPGLGRTICEPDGQIKRFLNVFVNGTDIRNLQGIDTPLTDGDEVIIAPAMAGGCPPVGAITKPPCGRSKH